MKKIIIIACITIVIILMTGILCSADGTSSGVVSLRVESYPSRTVYNAFEELDTDGLILWANYADGSAKKIDNSHITVKYNRDGCFRAGDGSVDLYFAGKSVRIPVTVNRIAYDLSDFDLDSVTVSYNGKLQSYPFELPEIIGVDGLPLSIKIGGGGISSGIYDLSIDFHTDSSDYLTPESRVIKLTVEPLEVNVIWQDTVFIYDGRSKSPSAYFIDVNGKRQELVVIGAATNAGENYKAAVSLFDRNYKLIDSETYFEIKKADYDMSDVKWSSESFVYDGGKKSVTVKGLPLGVSVISYSGDIATNAGKYTAVANLSWDRTNYNSPPPLSHSWEILAAEYDLSAVRFESKSYVYDGKLHYPELKGVMPTGADGIKLEYSFSTGASSVDEGVVAVVISFKTSSKNYNLPRDRYSSVTITPLGIDVEWSEINLDYNGKEQSPIARSDRCIVSVSGGKIDAGRYTAFASTDNPNYFIKNDTISFTINKAENFWRVAPEDSLCYEGRGTSLIGESQFGNMEYTYFSDKQCKAPISEPKAVGVYYVVISVAESKNYTGLRSKVVSLEIAEIKPVSFYAIIIKDDLRAFDKLSGDDILCSVINNDGSSERINASLVEVVYENYDSFRKKDSYVILKYKGFSLKLTVEVDYAEYDLSSINWQGAFQIYDGSEKTPLLCGLPDGVRVTRYVGGGVVNAGEYSVCAEVDYDKENYLEPSIPPCRFTIEKQRVSIPYITAVYNGQPIFPISSSEIFTIVEEKNFLNAGKYPISVKLKDPDNYIFDENSSESANAIFEILPAVLDVIVSDQRLMLFEPLGVAEYRISSGEIFGSDRIRFSTYREGKDIFLKSENPNYVFSVTPGKLIRLPYPTLKGGIAIIAILLAIALLVSLLVLTYRNRSKLSRIMAATKCRWHNKNYVVPEPREMDGIQRQESGEKGPDASLSFNKKYEEAYEELEESFVEGFIIPNTSIDSERADMLITDSLAKSLIKKEGEVVYTEGVARAVLNIDVISQGFSPFDRVDINTLKEKKLLESDVGYYKLTSVGEIDKPLNVYANEFSLSAVKMIALTGGKAIKVISRSPREKE